MKRLTTLALALIIMVPMLESCKKVSIRKLDGKWVVTTMTVARVDTDESNNVTSTDVSFDGTTRTTQSSYDPFDGPRVDFTDLVESVTITIEYDKKAGTYVQITTTTYQETEEDYPMWLDTTDLPNYGYRIEDYTVTSTDMGTYSITGGSGDVKKNSQIVMTNTSSDEEVSVLFSYEDSTGTSIVASNYYGYNISTLSYTKLPSGDQYTTSSTSAGSQGGIWNVDELKKGTLEISWSEDNSYTDASGDTWTTTSANSAVLEQE